VGHVPFSARPGEQGNCALAGHRDTFMRGLGGVRVNDVILIVTLGGTHTYRVEWSEVVEPERVDVLDATAASSLTLVTCYPFAFVGLAPQRFVVRAQMVTPDAERGVVSAGPDAGVATLSTQGRLK
jgi:sortase A